MRIWQMSYSRTDIRYGCWTALCRRFMAPKEQPPYLAPEVELLIADIRDGAALDRSLAGVDQVVHLVSLVGVGQSMYQIDEYTSVNNLGTAVLAAGA